MVLRRWVRYRSGDWEAEVGFGLGQLIWQALREVGFTEGCWEKSEKVKDLNK